MVGTHTPSSPLFACGLSSWVVRFSVAYLGLSRVALVALASVVVSLGVATAQEPSADKPAAAKPADGGLAKVTAAAASLDALRETMTKLSEEFGKATPERRAEIQAEAKPLQAKGMILLGQLVEAFPAAYAENPKHELVVEWLPRVLPMMAQLNRYPDIVALGGKLLAAEESAAGNVEQFVGQALYAEHRFKEAVAMLEKAKEAKRLDGQGVRTLNDSKRYEEFWATESALRETEGQANDLPRVLLKTSRGEIELELFENEAPGAVANFISLVAKKFYDGILFHRVIPGFMAQGGDPNTLDDNPANDGQGGPGYKIPCECGQKNARLHFAGSLSMAHAGKDTGGSQFFLTHLPTPHLNNKHTVFGRTLRGLDVLRALQIGDKIEAATVVRKRDHAYEPTKVGADK